MSVSGNYSPPYGAGTFRQGISEQEADAGYEMIQAKKRADGVKNGYEKAVADNTNGKKATADAIRLS